MEWSAIAPLLALVIVVLMGIGAIWYKLGRMEAKMALACATVNTPTPDGSRGTTPIPADVD